MGVWHPGVTLNGILGPHMSACVLGEEVGVGTVLRGLSQGLVSKYVLVFQENAVCMTWIAGLTL